MENLQRIQQLKNELNLAREKVMCIETELKEEIETFQRNCPHDEMLAERDGDYHKPGFYYTCTVCEYFTRYYPSNCKSLKYA
jgi:hypothetical protein